MKRIELSLDFGITKEERESYEVHRTDEQITWFVIDQCFSTSLAQGMSADQGQQYREIRLAFEKALKEEAKHVLLAASDFNFMKKHVESAKLPPGIAFIRPVVQEAIGNAVDENVKKK